MRITLSERLRSLPEYAFKEVDDKVAALRRTDVQPIDFGVGDPSSPVPEFVADALTPLARKHATTGYPSYIGSADFRAAAARYMRRRFGVELDPDTEICSNIGSKEAVFNFSEAFLNPGDIAIVPSPAYPPMKAGTIFAEGVPHFMPLLEENGFLLDYGAVPAEIAARARIVWINYPNSPTGTVATTEYYRGLLEWARAYDIIVAADEGCYIDIHFGQPPPSILEAGREGVAAFYSLSKRNNMTGYRVGFVAGDARVIDGFKRLKTNIDSGTPNFIQDAAVLALDDDTHVEALRSEYRTKGDILTAALADIGLPVSRPQATFYLWQRAPEGMDGLQFATRLLEPDLGIVVTPGAAISDECILPGGGTVNPGSHHVRFALMPTIADVEEAARRLRAAGPLSP